MGALEVVKLLAGVDSPYWNGQKRHSRVDDQAGVGNPPEVSCWSRPVMNLL